MIFLLPIVFVSHLIAQRIPASTHLAVRLDRTVSSRNARIGDRVRATLDQDMFVGGREVAHTGARVVAKVTYVRRSGRLHHPGYLTLRLDTINIRGRRYRLQSTAIRDEGNGHTRSNVEKIGGGAGLGAIIGAVAGGGKGALLGGLLGAGAGTGLAVATGRQPAEFHAEEVFDFALTGPARRIQSRHR
jgi:hypothetical protein